MYIREDKEIWGEKSPIIRNHIPMGTDRYVCPIEKIHSSFRRKFGEIVSDICIRQQKSYYFSGSEKAFKMMLNQIDYILIIQCVYTEDDGSITTRPCHFSSSIREERNLPGGFTLGGMNWVTESEEQFSLNQASLVLDYVNNATARDRLIDTLHKSFRLVIKDHKDFIILLGKCIGRKLAKKDDIYNALNGDKEFYGSDPIPTDLAERVANVVDTDPLSYVNAYHESYPVGIGDAISHYAREVINR